MTKKLALSGTEWNPFSFLFALSLYSLMRPKLFLSSTIIRKLRLVNPTKPANL